MIGIKLFSVGVSIPGKSCSVILEARQIAPSQVGIFFCRRKLGSIVCDERLGAMPEHREC